MYIVGQEKNLEIIEKWDSMPPFVIIQGDEHMGKTYLTTYLCKKFKLYYRELDNSVSTVRKLVSQMKPNGRTVYHFKNFHTASLEAKNALLKVTEEPVQGNYIVITGGPQLKTLESRARRILMAPYSESEMYTYMNAYFPEKTIQEALITCGINTPAKVEYYKEYEKLESLVAFTKQMVDKLTGMTPDIILMTMPRFENKYDGIDAYLLFLTMMINIIEARIKVHPSYSYDKILLVLLEGKKALIRQPTLKRKMLFVKMFYEIHLISKGVL